MDVERLAMFAGVGVALGVGAFVLWGPTPRPKRRGQISGITNLGFTCFLNSLLQAIAACPFFIQWLNEQSTKKKSTSFTNNLISVLDKINGYSDDFYNDIEPIEIITSLGKLWNFDPGHQDAHELFHVILNALQNETEIKTPQRGLSDALPITSPIISDIKGSGDHLSFRSVSCNDITKTDYSLSNKKNININISTKSIPYSSSSIYNKPGMIFSRPSKLLFENIYDSQQEISPTKVWNSLLKITEKSNISVLSNETHPFSGFLTSQLKCINCNFKSSVRYDKLETISLPLPPAGDVLKWRCHTLAELFSRLVTSEIIQNVDCDNCNTRCSAMKTLTIGKLPRCLCIQIPRTTWSTSGMPIKRDDPVIFPEIFSLDPFTFNETKKRNDQASLPIMLDKQNMIKSKHKYKLCAVVEHRGAVDAGHFVCYRRGNRIGQWYYTSDKIVENTSITDVLCASPYLIFYERIID